MKNKTLFYSILYPAVFVLALVLDRVTKVLAVNGLKDGKVVNVIGTVFQFVYLENRGAAFGMMQGRQILFYVITIAVCAVIVYLLIKLPKTKYFLAFGLTLSFILAGAIGNFIDRVSHDYVVDFIFFSPINFPVFNVADIYVTLGCIVLVFLILFYYKDKDFNFVKSKKGKEKSDEKEQS